MLKPPFRIKYRKGGPALLGKINFNLVFSVRGNFAVGINIIKPLPDLAAPQRGALCLPETLVNF